MSYTILAVTDRFVIAIDATGRRHRLVTRAALPVTPGQLLTAAEWAALESLAAQ